MPSGESTEIFSLEIRYYLQCLHCGIQQQSIAIIGEKYISERKVSIFKNVTNLHLFFCADSQIWAIKWLPGACPP